MGKGKINLLAPTHSIFHQMQSHLVMIDYFCFFQVGSASGIMYYEKCILKNVVTKEVFAFNLTYLCGPMENNRNTLKLSYK